MCLPVGAVSCRLLMPSLVFLLLISAAAASNPDWSDRGCPSSPYRSLDGTCNNVRRPSEGAAYSPFSVLVSSQRSGSSTTQASDRQDVLRLLETKGSARPNSHVTALLALWSELLHRDLSMPLSTDEGLVNGATGYLDGSGLYGTSEEEEALLLTSSGKINVQNCVECRRGSGLGGLYTLLYNEHNRIVDELSRLNKWTHEMLYQEARKILIAEIQHITYSEYLPLVLSQNDWAFEPVARGFSKEYSSNNAGGTYIETAFSALQLLPTMVPHKLASMKLNNDTRLRDAENHLPKIVMMALGPALEPNLHSKFNNAIQLIEFSRNHGLASYVEVVKQCSGQKIENFTQMTTVPEEGIQLLTTVYKTVEDVDLLVGGLLEPSVQGSLLGPTFSCLLASQFSSLKKSDRFWYENDLPPASFSKDQLSELRKVTLSGLLCLNLPKIRNIQPKAFVQDDPYLNAVLPCENHPELNLEPWKEEDNRRTEDDSASLMTLDLIKSAIQKAEEDVARRQRKEFFLYADKGGVDPKSPLGTAAAFSKPNRMALSLANNSLFLEYASQELISNLNNRQARRRRQLDGDNFISFDFGSKDLTDLDITDLLTSRPVESECREEEGPCDPRAPYRTFSGHCNNLERPHLGKSLTTFARLLPSVYENGISTPRLHAVTGEPLPSPRLVSSMVHADVSYLHGRYTLMVMQFAQFVDHDITFTPNHRGFFASIPDCRSCDSPLTVHPECMPIPIPAADPFYPQRNISTGARMCLPFMRSLPGQQRLGPREQINQNTAYLDGSQIYGEHACLARELRGYGGKMNATSHPAHGKDLLPISPSHPECKAPSGYCFIGGDGRASEQPGLTAFHTIYLREHNRIVDGLRVVNPHWGDEKLFQTARKIVIASYQHVLYNEFLPRILGWNAINLYGLKLSSQAYYKGYSSTCNPNVVTEFATAAYRIGHSLLRPHIPRMSTSYTPVEPAILLRDHFFNPDIIYQPHIIDDIMRGLASTPMESLDQFITGEITNHLFEDRRIPHSGMDLPALNIQRARDHGIPPYNEYRSLCNLKRAVTWENLSREIPPEVIARLRLIYPTVNDVDLFPGGLSERPLQGGLVGPTFACIIGLQFRQLRKCDRFWYESDDPIVRFSDAQLAEIRKSTLSKVVCANMDISSDIQRSAFDLPSDFLNPRVKCSSLPSIDLNAWRETVQTGCQIAGRTIAVGESYIPTPCTSCICTPDGAQCASLRVTDCDRLLREAGMEAVLEDEVCASQCGEYLTRQATILPAVSLTTRRPRTRGGFLPTSLVPPPPLRSLNKRRPHLRPFDFPSLLV